MAAVKTLRVMMVEYLLFSIPIPLFVKSDMPLHVKISVTILFGMGILVPPSQPSSDQPSSLMICTVGSNL